MGIFEAAQFDEANDFADNRLLIRVTSIRVGQNCNFHGTLCTCVCDDVGVGTTDKSQTLSYCHKFGNASCQFEIFYDLEGSGIEKTTPSRMETYSQLYTSNPNIDDRYF